jgi:hypothetical protein
MPYPEVTPRTPSPEEQHLIAIRDGAYVAAGAAVLEDVARGESPRIMSVVAPQHFWGLAGEMWLAAAAAPKPTKPVDGYKATLFNELLQDAEAGDPAAISALPKFASCLGQVATAIGLAYDNRTAFDAWRTDRPYVQFIGSFNPQHVGHRAAIARTLDVAGPRASSIVQVVADHPIKKDSLPPYKERFAAGEEKLYASMAIDPTRVTQLDVPLSLGLAKVGAEQIKLLAAVTGDPQPRWMVGSDKFMTDAKNVRAGKQLDKAGIRFSDVHLYVLRRASEQQGEIDEAADYVREAYGAQVTVVPEVDDPFLIGASATKVRALRAEGNHTAADAMEYGDLLWKPQSSPLPRAD